MEIELKWLGAEMDKNYSMWLAPLASSSSGNSSLIGDNNGKHILVDCGITCKRIIDGIKSFSIEPENINGIFITHEHTDHVKGLRVLLKKYKIPVFLTLGTFEAISDKEIFTADCKKLFNIIKPNHSLDFEGFKVNCFNIPHDAREPVGFSFEKNDIKVSICTDFGIATDEIEDGLKNSQAMVLEANHDERILEVGPYPYSLKRRILSNEGHISNENSGKLLAKIWNKDLKHVFLGHLSSDNNLPKLALQTVKCELIREHSDYESFTDISVAEKDGPSSKILL